MHSQYSFKITKTNAIGYKNRPYKVWFNEFGFYGYSTKEEALKFAEDRQGKALYSVNLGEDRTLYFHSFNTAKQYADSIKTSVKELLTASEVK